MIRTDRRILITGATGFLGSALCSYMSERPGNELFISAQRKRYGVPAGTWVEMPLYDPRPLVDSVQECHPDFIFHLANSWGVPAGADGNSLNCVATKNILDACKALRPMPVVVLTSSCAVYGQPDYGPDGIDETYPIHPLTAYGMEKARIESLALRYIEGGLPVIRVRPFNVTGPNEPCRLVVSAFAKQIAEIERGLKPAVITTGDLTASRDFTDVRDVASALAIAGFDGPVGSVFNICSGEETRISDLLTMLLSFVPFATRVEASDGDSPIHRQSGNPDRIHKLGWRRKFSLEESLKAALDYWRKSAVEKGISS